MIVSIIVPVYNAEKFLNKSIKSVLNQSYKMIELILVNDGSTDNSEMICNNYGKTDRRIKVLSKKNSGPAAARNTGISHATGDFIFFLDADDFIEENTIERLITIYNQYQPDMVMGNFSKLENNGVTIKQKVSFQPDNEMFQDQIKELSKTDIVNYVRHFLKHPSNHLISYCWARLYKLSVIKNNGIFANEDMRLFEDFVFNLDYLKYTNKIVFLNESLYIYTMHSSHISASMAIVNSDSLLHDMQVFKIKAGEFLQQKNAGKGNTLSKTTIKQEIGHALIHYVIIFLIRSCRLLNKNNRNIIYREIEKLINSEILKDSLQYYSPSKGNSKVLPLLMKHKLIDLMMDYCQYRAYKRYGNPEEDKKIYKADIINEIKAQELPVIIYGAGVVGKTLLYICKNEGIKIESFCDSSKKAAQSNFCNLEVIYAHDLKKKYRDAIFLISAAAIKDVVDLLTDSGFSKWYAAGLILKDLDISQNSPDASIDYTKFAIENCILCHYGYLNPDKLFLRSIDLIITERCSLKCRDCSNLMQYYEKPGDCNIDMLLKSIDVFFTVFDEVMDFRIIGGDTFMNKNWHIIVSRLADERRAKRIVLYTNGTIIPHEKYIPLLKNDKVLIIITDYGPLSKKLAGLKKMLEENKVSHHIIEITEWLDCSSIIPHNRTIEQNKEIFKNCCAKNMATLSDGKLFRCPYGANAHRLRAVPNSPGDYIDLFQEPVDSVNIKERKNKVKEYLLDKDYLDTCDYCSGRPLSGNEIPPAIQVKKPLKYQKYER
jgi:glycosyltransferase involved in cell wall biosynthesis